MNRLHFLAVACLGIAAATALAGTSTQRYIAKSGVCNKEMYYWVHLPSNYAAQVQAGKKFAVVYLLHQYSFWGAGWHLPSGQPNPQVNWLVDSVSGIICVAPDDGLNGKSWWLDSPANATSKLSTFLATELRDSLIKQYATYTDRAHWGICGTSMGGYGALHNLFVKSDVYSAGYSIVGCVDLNKWKGQFDIPAVLPTYSASYDILPNAAAFKNKNVKIGFYTTENDFFKDDNVAFDAALKTAGVAHEYQLLSGTHEMPTPQRMLMILRWFQTAFYGASASQPAFQAAAKRTGAAKHRAYLQLSRGGGPVGMSRPAAGSKGIDGRTRVQSSAQAVIIR